MDNLLPILYKNQVSDGSVIQICNKCIIKKIIKNCGISSNLYY